MFGVSGLFLVILFTGLIKAPFVVKRMEGSNYLFSDQAEMRMFETVLDENEIPYENISDSKLAVGWRMAAPFGCQSIIKRRTGDFLLTSRPAGLTTTA